MTMLVVVVTLALLGFALAAARFGADSRGLDAREPAANWPGVRHCG